MVPIRFLFRSRWAAMAWAAGICWTAISFVDEQSGYVNAANSADGYEAVKSALAAEDSE